MAKILIVDDDVTITNLMTMLMSMEGHEAFVINDSTRALATAGSVSPDLITLDLMMPELNGFELCQLLQQDPRFANIPIMIISASDDLQSKERARLAGAKEYVTKPFGVEDLMQKIKDLTDPS